MSDLKASAIMFARKPKLGMMAGVFAVSIGAAPASLSMASPARLEFLETVDVRSESICDNVRAQAKTGHDGWGVRRLNRCRSGVPVDGVSGAIGVSRNSRC